MAKENQKGSDIVGSQTDKLRPLNQIPVEEARRIQSMGGIASGEAKRRRKSLKEQLLVLLEDENLQKMITSALVNRSLNEQDAIGNKAYEIIRDTIGEKVPETVNIGSSPANELLDSINELKKQNEN